MVSTLLISHIALADQFICEGSIKVTNFKKAIKLTINGSESHTITLIPTTPEYKTENYSNVPVGVGEIEVKESIGNSDLVISSGKLIVTQKSENLITGVHDINGRPGLIRLDKNGQNWEFVYYDSSHQKELIIGACK